MSQRPCLLYLEKLVEPAMRAKESLQTVAEISKRQGSEETVRKGLFVLAVAHVESMLNDTLKYYLEEFPAKLDKASITLSKEDLLSHEQSIISRLAERFVWETAYKPLVDMVRIICKTMALEADPVALTAPLTEVKLKRNAILHQNPDQVHLPIEELQVSIQKMLNFVTAFTALLVAKYHKYTKVAAIKRLWEFSFNSPMLQFDDYWSVRLEDDCLGCRKSPEKESCISENERSFLDLWYAHWGGHSSDRTAVCMMHLDYENQIKVLQLLNAFRTFSIQPKLHFVARKTCDT